MVQEIAAPSAGPQQPASQINTTINLRAECLPSLEKEFLNEPSYNCPPGVPSVKLQATPAWVDVKPPRLRARCLSLRLVVWGTVIVTLVAAAVGLSVTMKVVHTHRQDDYDNAGGGHGGGGSSCSGSSRPARPGELGTPPFAAPAGWTAIWWDEFSGDGLDQSKWSYDLGTGDWGWGNNEKQKYTNSGSNVRVANGSLYITALRSPGGAYTSGRINTLGNAAFCPGMVAGGYNYTTIHVEARVQVPSPGQGIWPALWMFPVDLKYGAWAASGEVDIMESVNSMQTITQGIHFGGVSGQRVMSMQYTNQPDNSPWSTAFHTYAVDWAPNNIAFYIDGSQVAQFWSRATDPAHGWWTTAQNVGPNAPFDAPFYLIMDLAVGGLYPQDPDATTPASSTMVVDYVRVWAR
ncbi:hypothetical protein N2152v2_009370 [Parachlorella kessleri]